MERQMRLHHVPEADKAPYRAAFGHPAQMAPLPLTVVFEEMPVGCSKTVKNDPELVAAFRALGFEVDGVVDEEEEESDEEEYGEEGLGLGDDAYHRPDIWGYHHSSQGHPGGLLAEMQFGPVAIFNGGHGSSSISQPPAIAALAPPLQIPPPPGMPGIDPAAPAAPGPRRHHRARRHRMLPTPPRPVVSVSAYIHKVRCAAGRW